tara:strand:- start:288 stop:851 length:564 start_codon:yes stop_codon:yes gene_type:complete
VDRPQERQSQAIGSSKEYLSQLISLRQKKKVTSDITVISIFLALLLICLFNERLSSNQITITFLYYASTIACASLSIGAMPAWGVHALYALIAAPFIFVSSISGAISISAYSIFNLVVSADYIAYPSTGTIISNNFTSSQLFFAVLLIIGSVFKSKNDDYRIAYGFMDWMGSHKNLHRSVPKMEKFK